MRAYDGCGDTQVDTRAVAVYMCPESGGLNNSVRFTLRRSSKLYKISHRGGQARLFSPRDAVGKWIRK